MTMFCVSSLANSPLKRGFRGRGRGRLSQQRFHLLSSRTHSGARFLLRQFERLSLHVTISPSSSLQPAAEFYRSNEMQSNFHPLFFAPQIGKRSQRLLCGKLAKLFPHCKPPAIRAIVFASPEIGEMWARLGMAIQDLDVNDRKSIVKLFDADRQLRETLSDPKRSQKLTKYVEQSF